MIRGVGIALLVYLAAPTAAQGQDVAQPVPVDGQCAVPPDEHWTPQERFVWSRVCIGKIADFNREPGYGGDLDPKRPEGLPESRILSSAFLETIVLKDKYRRALTRMGVRIAGARFSEKLDFANASIGHELRLRRSLLEQGADFTRARSTEVIDFIKSKIGGMLDMSGLRTEKSLALQNGVEIAALDLLGARIGGDLELNNSTVQGTLGLIEVQVDGNLRMEDAEFSGVRLFGARVRDELDFSGCRVRGRVEMESVDVGGNLSLGSKFSCKEADSPAVDGKSTGGTRDADQAQCIGLTGAHIGGALDLRGSEIHGAVYGDSLRVGGNVFLGAGARYHDSVSLVLSRMAALDLASGTFDRGVDLTGTVIAGELRLGSPARGSASWIEGDDSILILRNAAADTIQDLPESWPDRLDLIGFTYRNLGSSGWTRNTSLADLPARSTEDRSVCSKKARKVGSLEEWLCRQEKYSPQPYEQLAGVLRIQGKADAADEILYASRERDRSSSDSFWHWIKATLLKLIIGYGYHLWWSVYWFFGLWVLGAFVQWTRVGGRVLHLRDARELRSFANDLPRHFVYSFEMLLPVVRFRGQTRDFLFGWQDVYFHIHGLVGLALAAFLGAGLAGLTK